MGIGDRLETVERELNFLRALRNRSCFHIHVVTAVLLTESPLFFDTGNELHGHQCPSLASGRIPFPGNRVDHDGGMDNLPGCGTGIQSSRPSHRHQRANFSCRQQCPRGDHGGFAPHSGIGDYRILALINLNPPIGQVLERFHVAHQWMHLAKHRRDNSNARHQL